MARWLLTVLLAVTGAGLANPIESPRRVYEADPGAFVSIPIVGSDKVALTVDAPPFLTVVGSPHLSDGRGLVNLLIGTRAPAGEHLVTIRAGAEILSVTVRVASRYGISLRGPGDLTMVRGETTRTSLVLTNTGNTTQTIALQLRSSLPAQLSPTRIELGGGESQDVELQLSPDAGLPTAVNVSVSVFATVAEDTNTRAFALVRTRILPFEGADAIDGPAMRYRVEVDGSYGSDGVGYGVMLQVAGALSDFVDASADFALASEAADSFTLTGRADLVGDSWSVGYQGTRSTHRMEARYRDFVAFTAITPGNTGFGISYSPSPLTVSFALQAGARNRQSLSASYRIPISRELSLTPAVAIARESTGFEHSYSALLGLTADLRTEPLVASALLRFPISAGEDWYLAGTLRSRVQEPIGFEANASVGPGHTAAQLVVNESVSPEVTLQQRLDYRDGRGSVDFAVRYRSAWEPVLIRVYVGAGLDSRGIGIRYGASAAYTPRPFSVRAHVSTTTSGDWYYGASAVYETDPWGASIDYSHTPHVDLVSIDGRLHQTGLTGTAGFAVDLRTIALSGRLGLEYTFRGGHTVYSRAVVGSSVAWELGATLVLEGGFATPPGIVGAFGGRTTGLVTGVVFEDNNRNGMLDSGEVIVPAVTITSGPNSTQSDEQGRFSLTVPPGQHRLLASGHTASLGLIEPMDMEVSVGQVLEVDVPLAPVATVIVSVFDDGDRSGEIGEAELRLAHVVVNLESTDGGIMRAETDARGEAIFQNLLPGTYVARIAPESLPQRYSPTSEQVAIEARVGPILRFELGATQRPLAIAQTLSLGDLSLTARLGTTSIPPGADVLVVARVGGSPDAVTARLATGGASVRLTLTGDTYQGRVSLPTDATGLVMIHVEASRGETTRTQTLPLVVSPGPSATVVTTPTLARPGEELGVTATLLVRVESATVHVDGAEYPLNATSDPYLWVGQIAAPQVAGSFVVELYGDGEKLGESRFRVQ